MREDHPAEPFPEQGLTHQEAEVVLRQMAAGLCAALAAPPPRAAPAAGTEGRGSAPKPPGGGAVWPPVSRPETGAQGPLLTENQIRALLEAAPEGKVLVNAGGTIVEVNSRTVELFGYRREELLGQPVELLVPERLRRQHVADRDGYCADPQARPMGSRRELHGRHRDGHEFPVEISLSPLDTADGLLVISTIRDVSERKRAEHQLRRAEARYRTLVEGIPAVTFIAPLDEQRGERGLYVSPQIERLLGFSQQEWLENPVLWYRQLHPDDRPRWHEEFARTCSTGEPFRSVYRFLSLDGRVVWVQGEATVVRDDDGRPLFLQGFAFDITGIKQAEEALKALNETLEQRVAERTALAEQRARELARSNEELEKFAYVASHDLKEPLRTLSNYPKLLAKRYLGRLDDTADDFMKRIIAGADNMERLIDDLSKYARVVRGERSIAPTDCTRVYDEARANLRAAIEESEAEVTAGPLPTVPANATELMLLFQNLIGNAVKFRADRPVRVEVAAERQGEEWLFSVRDNGIGIEQQYLGKIFGLGERLHSKRLYPGTGFGLAICQKIVEGHGGRIWVASEPGRGSTFYFTLPVGAEP